jgi:chorismate mutase/prephenate dehydratase
MARKSDSDSTTTSTKTATALKHMRAQIDKLDLQILDLVNKRAALAGEIGKLKNDQSNEVFTPSREEEVLKTVLDASKGPLDSATIRAIFRELISGSRALQKVIKVAYLGPEYSYSYLAAVDRFGHAVDLVRVGSIAAVFEEVNRGHVDFGIVPLENSTDGRIADTLDMFVRLPQIKICSEARLRIHHNLLARCSQQEIRRVYSKPQVLAQCRTWLSKNVPHAAQVEVASTATAADLASKEPGAAAVASRQASVAFNLPMLFSDIEDLPNNEARFAIIGHQEAARTGQDKTAVMFRVPHNPGALVEVLEIFRHNKINLTWIESFPGRSVKPEYVFFIDFEGHAEDSKVRRTLTALQEHSQHLTVLGSYPAALVSNE